MEVPSTLHHVKGAKSSLETVETLKLQVYFEEKKFFNKAAMCTVPAYASMPPPLRVQRLYLTEQLGLANNVPLDKLVKSFFEKEQPSDLEYTPIPLTSSDDILLSDPKKVYFHKGSQSSTLVDAALDIDTRSRFIAVKDFTHIKQKGALRALVTWYGYPNLFAIEHHTHIREINEYASSRRKEHLSKLRRAEQEAQEKKQRSVAKFNPYWCRVRNQGRNKTNTSKLRPTVFSFPTSQAEPYLYGIWPWERNGDLYEVFIQQVFGEVDDHNLAPASGIQDLDKFIKLSLETANNVQQLRACQALNEHTKKLSDLSVMVCDGQIFAAMNKYDEMTVCNKCIQYVGFGSHAGHETFHLKASSVAFGDYSYSYCFDHAVLLNASQANIVRKDRADNFYKLYSKESERKEKGALCNKRAHEFVQSYYHDFYAHQTSSFSNRLNVALQIVVMFCGLNRIGTLAASQEGITMIQETMKTFPALDIAKLSASKKDQYLELFMMFVEPGNSNILENRYRLGNQPILCSKLQPTIGTMRLYNVHTDDSPVYSTMVDEFLRPYKFFCFLDPYMTKNGHITDRNHKPTTTEKVSAYVAKGYDKCHHELCDVPFVQAGRATQTDTLRDRLSRHHAKFEFHPCCHGDKRCDAGKRVKRPHLFTPAPPAPPTPAQVIVDKQLLGVVEVDPTPAEAEVIFPKKTLKPVNVLERITTIAPEWVVIAIRDKKLVKCGVEVCSAVIPANARYCGSCDRRFKCQQIPKGNKRLNGDWKLNGNDELKFPVKLLGGGDGDGFRIEGGGPKPKPKPSANPRRKNIRNPFSKTAEQAKTHVINCVNNSTVGFIEKNYKDSVLFESMPMDNACGFHALNAILIQSGGLATERFTFSREGGQGLVCMLEPNENALGAIRKLNARGITIKFIHRSVIDSKLCDLYTLYPSENEQNVYHIMLEGADMNTVGHYYVEIKNLKSDYRVKGFMVAMKQEGIDKAISATGIMQGLDEILDQSGNIKEGADASKLPEIVAEIEKKAPGIQCQRLIKNALKSLMNPDIPVKENKKETKVEGGENKVENVDFRVTITDAQLRKLSDNKAGLLYQYKPTGIIDCHKPDEIDSDNMSYEVVFEHKHDAMMLARDAIQTTGMVPVLMDRIRNEARGDYLVGTSKIIREEWKQKRKGYGVSKFERDLDADEEIIDIETKLKDIPIDPMKILASNEALRSRLALMMGKEWDFTNCKEEMIDLKADEFAAAYYRIEQISSRADGITKNGHRLFLQAFRNIYCNSDLEEINDDISDIIADTDPIYSPRLQEFDAARSAIIAQLRTESGKMSKVYDGDFSVFSTHELVRNLQEKWKQEDEESNADNGADDECEEEEVNSDGPTGDGGDEQSSDHPDRDSWVCKNDPLKTGWDGFPYARLQGTQNILSIVSEMVGDRFSFLHSIINALSNELYVHTEITSDWIYVCNNFLAIDTNTDFRSTTQKWRKLDKTEHQVNVGVFTRVRRSNVTLSDMSRWKSMRDGTYRRDPNSTVVTMFKGAVENVNTYDEICRDIKAALEAFVRGIMPEFLKFIADHVGNLLEFLENRDIPLFDSLFHFVALNVVGTTAKVWRIEQNLYYSGILNDIMVFDGFTIDAKASVAETEQLVKRAVKSSIQHNNYMSDPDIQTATIELACWMRLYRCHKNPTMRKMYDCEGRSDDDPTDSQSGKKKSLASIIFGSGTSGLGPIHNRPTEESLWCFGYELSDVNMTDREPTPVEPWAAIEIKPNKKIMPRDLPRMRSLPIHTIPLPCAGTSCPYFNADNHAKRVDVRRPAYSREDLYHMRRFAHKMGKLIQPIGPDDAQMLESRLEDLSVGERQQRLFALGDYMQITYLQYMEIGIFTKWETYMSYKSGRNIMPFDLCNRMMMALMFHVMEKRVYSSLPCFVKGMTPRERAQAIIKMPNLGVYVATDFTSFESHHTIETTRIIIDNVIGRVMVNYPAWQLFRKELIDSMDTGKHIGSGFIAFTKSKLSSGHGLTAFFSALLNAVIVGSVHMRVAPSLIINQILERFKIEGDDGLDCVTLDELNAMLAIIATMPITLKLEKYYNLEDAGFCSTWFGSDGNLITDPLKCIQNCGYTNPQYAHSPKSTLDMLQSLKARSYLKMYPGCPILSAFCRYIIRECGEFTDEQYEKLLSKMKMSMWERERLMLVLRVPGEIDVQPTMPQRYQMASVFDYSLETQTILENYFDNKRGQGFFQHALLNDHMHSHSLDYYDSYCIRDTYDGAVKRWARHKKELKEYFAKNSGMIESTEEENVWTAHGSLTARDAIKEHRYKLNYTHDYMVEQYWGYEARPISLDPGFVRSHIENPRLDTTTYVKRTRDYRVSKRTEGGKVKTSWVPAY